MEREKPVITKIEKLSADKRNIEALAGLERDIFPDSWSEKALKETLGQKQAAILGAWIGDELAGYIILYYVLDECEIARIAVKPAYRRRGAAGRLLEETEIFCHAKEIKRLLLEVRESNFAARTFYQKHGFEIDGIRKNFYTNPPEDAILMSHRLVKPLEKLTALSTRQRISEQI